MEEKAFRFKTFEVRHSRSTMKVGVDAVLIGAWAGENARSVLDVGTGCGVISLILAHRFPEANIFAIDIDGDSVEEARENFSRFSGPNIMEARQMKFPDDVVAMGEKFDFVVSNPPFFRSGINSPSTRREKARHIEELSVFSLLENSDKLLTPEGRLAVIYPWEFRDQAEATAILNGLKVARECGIRNREDSSVKRVMTEFIKSNNHDFPSPQRELLTLFEDGEPTQEYLSLCHELYLKF